MKKSSYQKLKEENKILKRHIYMIVEFPEALETLKLYALYKMKFDKEYHMLFGKVERDDLCNKLDCLILDKALEDYKIDINSGKIPDPKQ